MNRISELPADSQRDLRRLKKQITDRFSGSASLIRAVFGATSKFTGTMMRVAIGVNQDDLEKAQRSVAMLSKLLTHSIAAGEAIHETGGGHAAERLAKMHADALEACLDLEILLAQFVSADPESNVEAAAVEVDG